MRFKFTFRIHSPSTPPTTELRFANLFMMGIDRPMNSELQPKILIIEDPSDSRIEIFRSLKGQHPRLDEQQLTIFEGEQQVERLFEYLIQNSSFDKWKLKTLFIQDLYLDKFLLLLSKINSPLKELEIFSASRSIMGEIIGYRLHSGIFALCHRPNFLAGEKISGSTLALSGLIDPENVGSIIRSASAFGINNIIIDEETVSPYHRRCIRVSMGAILEMNIILSNTLIEDLPRWKKDYSIIALEQHADSISLQEIRLPEKCIFILGNERNGIPESLLKIADEIVHIPMNQGVIHSLNVSIAAGILLSCWSFIERKL
jgi:tRNA G18 (ribose-2'-O)-methylase SpoU